VRGGASTGMTTPISPAAIDPADLAGVFDRYARDLLRYCGRRLVAVRHTEQGNGDEILFDPATGQAVGRRTVTLDPDVTVTAPGDAPKLEPGVLYQATWTQKVVAAVGAR